MIAEGSTKLASVPSGGAGSAAAPAAAAGSGAAAAAPAAEEKVEEKEACLIILHIILCPLYPMLIVHLGVRRGHGFRPFRLSVSYLYWVGFGLASKNWVFGGSMDLSLDGLRPFVWLVTSL